MPCTSAASATAPAPSATVFSRSSSSRMALAISSSSTVTMSSTYFATTGSVRTPARRTSMPSASVTDGASVTGSCSSSARCIDGTRAVCTPMIWMRGLISFIATAMPLMRPPPPTGTITASRYGFCSSSSRPMVPCPAMTASSSKAWMKVRPCASRSGATPRRRPRRSWRRAAPPRRRTPWCA